MAFFPGDADSSQLVKSVTYLLRKQSQLMTEERAHRRLAAILAADVVGFSRLMAVDEPGTMAALKARRREVLMPLVAKHQGRVFKVAGDGVMVEFASAVNAVECAVELQQAMASANRDIVAERHIILRVGINLGDVMVEGSDLYGDGVNVAARLEFDCKAGLHRHFRHRIRVYQGKGSGRLRRPWPTAPEEHRRAGARLSSQAFGYGGKPAGNARETLDCGPRL